jgi:FAD/FMN-containing dehydrogenase
VASTEIPLDFVAPGDPDWDKARSAFNLAADQRPELIAYPESAEDVVAAIGFARANGLRIAPQRTGHAAQAIDSLAGALLLRTDRLRAAGRSAGAGSPATAGVAVDPAARTARIVAGATWGEVADLATPHGLSPIAGSSRTVGVAGYHLGGGLSLVSRKLGLAANAVRAIELVTAGGSLVRATADSEPELFWALRGGGGNFGVVTALEIDLFETPEIYAGNLLYPVERAREVLHAWREATLTAPDELTLSARILQVPDVPGPPPPLRGRSFAVVDVVFLGGESDAAELLAPLRALDPEIDTAAPAGPDILGRVHMDPEDPVPALTDHILTGPLPPEAIDAFVDAVGPDSGSTLVVAELRQTGGALSRPASGGVLDSLPGDYFGFGVGALMAPGAKDAVRADLDRLREALLPHDAGSYFNFSERPAPISTFFPANVVARLRAVKDRWDPDNLFIAGHPID